MSRDRIEKELAVLREGGKEAILLSGSREVVIYRAGPSHGAHLGLQAASDVVVPVPSGYPASMIDLAGLPLGSPLLPHVRGGANSQGIIEADGRQWQLASYHPHNGGGAPPWD